ncbi:MAG TPA: MerR family transcriptional regulator [Ktedonobacterales bacterium]|jgi:DNA-binding transcriptional MerR regulator/GGDEF domain-containing protein|nr:MerR family transcriptional regulator [Ktedonobacterales bacterium]
MVTFKARLSLSELLMQPNVIEQLRERFKRIQDGLSTTISEASDLTRLSEAQLRYAEARGLLAPNRALGANVTSTHPRGQRRYTVDNLLRAYLIAFILDHGYSLSEIATFMENNASIIHELLETTTLHLKPVLDGANDILFKRFFIPRVLYYALSLIFERDTMSDVGLVFPVRSTPDELNVISPGEVETADDLIHLGHIVVAWRARGRPFSTFMTAGNPFDHEQSVHVTPFSQLAAVNAQQWSANSLPIQAYIAYSPSAEPELAQADRLLANRQQRDVRVEPGARRPPNPRDVSGRLIRHVQMLSCSDVMAIGQTETRLSDALFYNAPGMVNPALGDALLNQLTESIVTLGGPPRPRDLAGACDEDEPASTRWRFSCVLEPREIDSSLKRQELVVAAQSSQGPHRVGVTTASPQLNGGLTFLAYSSGRVTYRPEVLALDPAVSYVREESPIKSALAAPAVDGQGLERSQPPAVIYIASKYSDAFDSDDFLLIRVMGRLVGEIVRTYSSREHLPNALTDTLADPEIVDGYFADFLSESSFVSDLQHALRGTLSEPALEEQTEFSRDIQTLTLIGLDVNDYSSIQRLQGDRVARLLTRELGNRLKQRMHGAFAHGILSARLYRPWGDRFYMLVRDEDVDKARQRAERIRQDISRSYQIDGETLNSMRNVSDSAGCQQPGVISVNVRMAGVTLTRDALGVLLQRAGGDVTKCVAGLSRLLDDGLKQANDRPADDAPSVWWNVDLNAYEATTSAQPAEQA